MAYIISSGETSSGIILINNSMTILGGGTANSATVNSGGRMNISSGGMANNTTINNNGWINVSNGGTANSTIMNGGLGFVFSGGTVNNTTINNGECSVFISSGGTADNTIMSGGSFIVESGGTANNIVWTPCIGRVRVSNGGVATFASEYSGIYYGSNNKLLSQTAKMDGLEVNSNGQLYVMSGGTVKSTTINSFADFNLYCGGVANDTVMNGGWGYIYSGGTADGTTVYAFSHLYVYSGGTANNTTVTDYEGRVEVYSGGTVNSTTISSGGSLLISSGGTANNTTVYSGGNLSVLNCGTATNTTINNSGYISVAGGGMVNSTTVNSGGRFNVNNGGTATEIIENGGFVIIAPGAEVSFVSHAFSGLNLFSSATVHSGTTATNTKISGGNLQVYSSGIANSTTIYGNGCLTVMSGGIIDSVKTYAGGELSISQGGILTGKMNFLAGAVFLVESGAVVNFDLTQVSAGEKAILNDWSLIQGTPDYLITVGGNQEKGIYKLADAADDFDGTITVKNTGGESIGTLTVGETITVDNMDYSLNLIDGTLSMRIDSSSVPADLTFFPGDYIGNRKSILAVADEPHVTIYRNKGIVWSELTLDDECEIAGVGDFNGDGADDFLTVHSSGLVIGEMSDGYEEFDSQVLNFLNEGWDILGIGDFDGNGTDDVLIANPTGASETVGLLGYWESGTSWTLINGYSAEWECVSTGDFNGDGKCDMLWRNSFEGDGGLTYNAYCTWIVEDPVDWRMVSVANPAEWNFLCSGDFNGDKMNDIAMINSEGVVGVWGVNDGYLSSWSILSAVTPEWTLAGVADFNGDGTDDMAWANTETGKVGCWQIEDKELAGWQTIVTLS